MDAMHISRTGMDVEWQRLQVIAQNLANANSSRTSSGQPVRALHLVTGPKGGFAEALKAGTSLALPSGVAVLGVTPGPDGGIKRVYQPGNPDADSSGYVTLPAVDQAEEMTLLIKASRVYEANLTALNIAHQMYSRALELGRQA